VGRSERRERLREVPRVRQHPDEEGRRRWFTCGCADLFVWENDETGVLRFEFCYGKPRAERTLGWDPAQGSRHAAIDDGESSAARNRTPIAVSDGRYDPGGIALEFERVAAEVEPRLFRFVLERLLAGA